MTEKPRLAVGVSVLLTNQQGQLLLGKRKNNTAAGLWSTPGGRIELEEDMFTCAARELKEETGVIANIQNMEVVDYKEHLRYGDHYFMCYIHVWDWTGEVQNMEPDKCEGWEWFDFRSNGYSAAALNKLVMNLETTEPFDILFQLSDKLRQVGILTSTVQHLKNAHSEWREWTNKVRATWNLAKSEGSIMRTGAAAELDKLMKDGPV